MAKDMHNSVWAHLTPPRPAAARLEQALTMDAVVIGGGLTGLSAAYHLARAGSTVALVEGRSIGWGASGRNNGQVIPSLAALDPAEMQARFGPQATPFIHMVRDSADALFDFIRSHGLDCDAEQTGWFQPAHSPEYLRLSEARAKAWQQQGAPVEVLDKPAGDALLGSSHWYGGMLNPTGGHVNPLKLSYEMARLCAGAGVQIFEHTPATFVTRKGRGWQVTTPEGMITASTVLLATNAYTEQNVEPRIERAVIPLTAYQLATAPLSRARRAEILPGRQAVSDTRGDLWYFRYTRDHRLVTGAALLLKAGARLRLKSLLRRRLETAFPALAPLEFSHIWQGFVGVTPDHAPRFHELAPGYFAFTGYNGRGLALTLSVGREFAQKMLGEPCALPFAPPRPIRLHGVVKHVARARLVLTRMQDKKPPKV